MGFNARHGKADWDVILAEDFLRSSLLSNRLLASPTLTYPFLSRLNQLALLHDKLHRTNWLKTVMPHICYQV